MGGGQKSVGRSAHAKPAETTKIILFAQYLPSMAKAIIMWILIETSGFAYGVWGSYLEI